MKNELTYAIEALIYILLRKAAGYVVFKSEILAARQRVLVEERKSR